MGFPKYFIKHFEDIKNSLIFASIKRTFKKRLFQTQYFTDYNNQLHPIKKYRVYRNLISTNTISIKKEITILRN